MRDLFTQRHESRSGETKGNIKVIEDVRLPDWRGRWPRAGYVLTCGAFLIVTEFASDALAQSYVGVADYRSCPRAYLPDSWRQETFSSERACIEKKLEIERSLHCAHVACAPATDGSAGGNGGDDATTNLLVGMLTNDSTKIGQSLGSIGADMLLGAFKDDPKARAARDLANARKEQERQEGEAKRLAQQEEAKKRILNSMKGAEFAPELTLKVDSDIVVAKVDGPLGTSRVMPIGLKQVSPEGGLQLKLDDEAEALSNAARSGFDTAGALKGAVLPDPPPVPKSAPVQTFNPRSAEWLRAKLQTSETRLKILNAQLSAQMGASSRDDKAISALKKEIAVAEDDNKKIMLDLTAADPDALPGNTGTVSNDTSATASPQNK